MAKFSGILGDLTIGGTALKVSKWSADYEQEILDSTDKGDGGWHSKVNGLRQITGSAEAFYTTTLQTGDPPFPMSQAGAAFVLHLGDGSTGTAYFSFTGFISKMSFESAVDGVISYTVDYESSGAVTTSYN